jgi:hypothetical protein
MTLEEFVRRALQDIAAGLNKATTEGAVAIAYVDRVVFEVSVVVSHGANKDDLVLARGDQATGRLTFTVATDAGVSPYPESER